MTTHVAKVGSGARQLFSAPQPQMESALLAATNLVVRTIGRSSRTTARESGRVGASTVLALRTANRLLELAGVGFELRDQPLDSVEVGHGGDPPDGPAEVGVPLPLRSCEHVAELVPRLLACVLQGVPALDERRDFLQPLLDEPDGLLKRLECWPLDGLVARGGRAVLGLRLHDRRHRYVLPVPHTDQLGESELDFCQNAVNVCHTASGSRPPATPFSVDLALQARLVLFEHLDQMVRVPPASIGGDRMSHNVLLPNADNDLQAAVGDELGPALFELSQRLWPDRCDWPDGVGGVGLGGDDGSHGNSPFQVWYMCCRRSP